MTTDFRALCAELLIALENAISIIYYEDGTKHISTAKPIVNRARAALADEPAVPEGREPVAVIGEPSDKRPTVMEIIELSSEIEAAGLGQVDFARAVLARWGNSMPVPPADEELTRLWFETDGRAVLGAKEYARAVLARWGNLKTRVTSSIPADGEVAELVAWLQNESHHHDLIGETLLRRAAELLQRQVLVPVPVSERWPEFSDCDDADRVWCWSWAIGTWRLSRINRSIHTHWLSAHALPVPEVK